MRCWTLILLAACGGDDPPGVDAPPGDTPTSQCQPLPAIGQFTRRSGNPEIIAGATFTDAKLDVGFSDPDLRFDSATNQFHLYYTAEHSTSFGTPGTQLIRRATSPDRMAWTVGDLPVLEPSTDVNAWDRATTEAPSVVFNPDAPAGRRYLMMYSGSSRAFPHPGYDFPEAQIGAAFSADGINFTRVSAAESPHGETGLVLKPGQVFQGSLVGAIVDDPEIVLQDGVYHLFFSSFRCEGTSCATVLDTGVGHATSADGLTWTVAQTPVKSLLEASADNKTGGFAPSAIYDVAHCRWELWQNRERGADPVQPVDLDNTNGVFHADSNDAAQWSVFFTSPRDLSWNQASPAAGEKLGMRRGFDIADLNGGRVMVYVGYDDQNVPANSTLPTTNGTRSGVMTINIATRDVP